MSLLQLEFTTAALCAGTVAVIMALLAKVHMYNARLAAAAPSPSAKQRKAARRSLTKSARPPTSPGAAKPAPVGLDTVAACKVLAGKWRARSTCPRVDRVAAVLAQQDAASTPLTKEVLVGLSEAVREQTLGERLYACVKILEPRRPGKVTGMILELSDDEILQLLASGGDASARATALSSWVDEANGVLDEAAAQEQAEAAAREAAQEQQWTVVERKTTRTRRRGASRSPDTVVAAMPAVA